MRPSWAFSAAAIYDPLWATGVQSKADIVIVLAGLLLLLRWNVPPLVIVALAELREILERWVYQVADYRDWQLEQIAEYGADGAAGSS